MSRILRPLLLLLLTVGLVGGTIGLRRYLSGDPFKGRSARDMMGEIGIRLDNVLVKHYDKDKLVGVADVKQVDVRQDRQFLDFKGISNGSFQTPQGSMTFSADQASFNAITRELNVTSGAHLSNKDMAIVSPAFVYNQQTGILNVPGAVTGTLYDGNIEAQNLLYNANEKSYEIQKVRWIGTLPKGSLQDVGQSDTAQKTAWRIQGGFKQKGDTQTFTDYSASDGDILVKGPLVKRDTKSDVLTCTGKVYYFSEKANVVCDKAVIYRKEKRAVLTGNVHMLVKPKDAPKLDLGEIPPFRPPVPADIASKRPTAPPDQEAQQQKDLDDEVRSSKTSRKYPTHVKADKIEYWYAKGKRHAIITGSPDAYQELPENRWRRVTTFKALYDGEGDTLTLESNSGKKEAHMVNSIGDNLVAKSFTVSTKEDNDEYEGVDVSGDVYSTGDEVPGSSSSGGGTAQPAPVPPAGPPGQKPPTTPPTTPPATTGGGGGKIGA